MVAYCSPNGRRRRRKVNQFIFIRRKIFTNDNSNFIFFRTYVRTKTLLNGQPDPPAFTVDPLSPVGNRGRIKIFWLPNRSGYSGSNFYVKYRIKNEEWTNTDPIVINDFVIISDLSTCQTYEIIVVSIDGDKWAESPMQTVFIGTKGPHEPHIGTMD